MKLIDLLKAFEDYAPFSLQEGYDNSGIQVGNADKIVKKGLVCLDITESIIEEAIIKGCDLIISHHPLIFTGLKQITGKNYIERIVVKAIQHDIAILSVHTNLDGVINGVNDKLAQKLGLQDLKILERKKGLLKKLVTFCPTDKANEVREAIFKAGAGTLGDYDSCSFNIDGKGTFRAGENTDPYVGERGEFHIENEVRIEVIFPTWLQSKVINALLDAHPYEEVAYDIFLLDNSFEKAGAGMMGMLKEPLEEKEFLALIRKALGCQCIRHSTFTGKPIKNVALCGGSGSFLKEKAIAAGADAFVSADIKYHDFFDVQGKLLMADVGHYESEQFTKEILYDIVTKKFTNFALQISDHSTNAVRYFQ